MMKNVVVMTVSTRSTSYVGEAEISSRFNKLDALIRETVTHDLCVDEMLLTFFETLNALKKFVKSEVALGKDLVCVTHL